MIPFDLFAPKKTALLVVDKQNGYADAATLGTRSRHLPANFDQTLRNLDTFIEVARAISVPVLWTKMTEDIEISPDPIRKKMELQLAGEKTQPIMAKPGVMDYDFAGRVVPTKTEPIFEKDHYDSFSNPLLGEYFVHHSIQSVILVGGFLPRCVLGTAYGANNNNLHVLLLENLSFEPLEFAKDREASLSIIQAILGYVDNSENLLLSWDL